jgi:hypothetical protein
VAIKRLTPTVRDLGYLRLWREEIAEIAGYASQLRDVKITMEADNNELDDVQADLPKIGKRLSYFTLTATRPDDAGQPQEVLKVYLTSQRCRVEADNADTEVRGIIADIEDAARRYRRVPRSFPHLPTTPVPSEQPPYAGLYFSGAIGAAVLAILSALSITFYASKDTGNIGIPWPWSISTEIVGALLLIGVAINEVRSRTILTTATRSEAPTGWQEYRGHIAIAIIFGLIFFFLGALVHF